MPAATRAAAFWGVIRCSLTPREVMTTMGGSPGRQDGERRASALVSTAGKRSMSAGCGDQEDEGEHRH